MCRGLFGLVLVVLLVSFIETESAICETRSQLFRGLCFRADNCASICEKEGFLTGECKGFLFRCICQKECGDGASRGGSSGSAGGPQDGEDGGDGGDGGDAGDGGSPDGPSGDPMSSNRSIFL
ncbi:hypothetical protein CDL12_27986 [Handroanthus impetiginosus]|uniref:Knottins-like domain-containing protein n=1 Tax=Handroanthus impetiginosus TaxID=429701 RepID=A0A2G9G3N2_9LAMI|nr:hypothetical protein CDL12_27986 [Handroanthus impetiginosus]